jgi:hypothetical protein
MERGVDFRWRGPAGGHGRDVGMRKPSAYRQFAILVECHGCSGMSEGLRLAYLEWTDGSVMDQRIRIC